MLMDDTRDRSTPAAVPGAGADTVPDDERRAALAKLGLLAAYTAPAVVTLMVSRRASAESLPGPPNDPFSP